MAFLIILYLLYFIFVILQKMFTLKKNFLFLSLSLMFKHYYLLRTTLSIPVTMDFHTINISVFRSWVRIHLNLYKVMHG